MHISICIITWENLFLIYHHKLIHFPSKKEHFLQLRIIFTKYNNHYTPSPEIQSATPSLTPPQCLACENVQSIM